jgi:hypothetical protein
MSFPEKTIEIEGNEILVTCEKVLEDHCHRYRFSARLGDFTHHHALTIGPVDGEFITPTEEQFQRDVDAAREQAAKHVHLRHIVKELESRIK